MKTYYSALQSRFSNIARNTVEGSNPSWTSGDGMWSWANAYLYESEAWPILESRCRYKFGSGSTTWYILDADTIRKVCKYNLNPVARCNN